MQYLVFAFVAAMLATVNPTALYVAGAIGAVVWLGTLAGGFFEKIASDASLQGLIKWVGGTIAALCILRLVVGQ